MNANANAGIGIIRRSLCEVSQDMARGGAD
jgi:hypothetical protein